MSLCWLSFPVGTSDPYVKFKIAGKEVFRSKTIHKNLNPVWDERVTLHVETLKDPLYVKVSVQLHPAVILTTTCNKSHFVEVCWGASDSCCVYFLLVGFWLWLWIPGWLHGLSVSPPGVTGTSEVSLSTLTSFFIAALLYMDIIHILNSLQFNFSCTLHWLYLTYC